MFVLPLIPHRPNLPHTTIHHTAKLTIVSIVSAHFRNERKLLNSGVQKPTALLNANVHAACRMLIRWAE